MDGTPIPQDLAVTLTDFEETLRPDYAVRERDPRDGFPPWQLLVRVLDDGRDFERAVRETGSWTPRPTRAWSGSCAKPGGQRGCSSTATLCG
jgi:hypothetical protein